VEYRADVGGGLIEHEVVDIFIGEVAPGVEPVPNADEVMDTIWQPLDASAEEVARRPSGFTPWLQIYLRDHARSIFGTVPA
jgi:isopentenyl-diphosphate delta-isomerase